MNSSRQLGRGAVCPWHCPLMKSGRPADPGDLHRVKRGDSCPPVCSQTPPLGTPSITFSSPQPPFPSGVLTKKLPAGCPLQDHAQDQALLLRISTSGWQAALFLCKPNNPPFARWKLQAGSSLQPGPVPQRGLHCSQALHFWLDLGIGTGHWYKVTASWGLKHLRDARTEVSDWEIMQKPERPEDGLLPHTASSNWPASP